MRSDAPTPSATTVPGSSVARAITTPSSGCRRITNGGAMSTSLKAGKASGAAPRPPPPKKRGRAGAPPPPPPPTKGGECKGAPLVGGGGGKPPSPHFLQEATS